MRLLTLLAIIPLFLLGCASIGKDQTEDWTAEQFYEEAQSAIENSNYESAVNWFSKLEARYPYGRYAQQAQLETIFAYYKMGETEAAISAADRFIKLHPRHNNVDYAYYLRGLASFDTGKGLLDSLADKDPADSDPSMTRRSFNYFRELVTRYPESRYNEDAVQKMKELRNTLARHEVNVADFYLRRNAHLAAVNRAKYVVENYTKTPAVPDALAVMVRGYRAMGMDELAQDTMRVLQQNYPDHPQLIKLHMQ